MLKVGYVDIHNLNDRFLYQTEGVPQGSIISPLFSNIFLNELDSMIEKHFIPQYNVGVRRRNNPDYDKMMSLSSNDKKLLETYPELTEPLKRVKHRRNVLNSIPRRDPNDSNFRRLYYIRYADDFVLGFSGPKYEADGIMKQIKAFLKEKLKLDVNEEKSKLTHGSKQFKYLGTLIR